MNATPLDSRSPAEHYDVVTDAWGFLLEDNLHYGLFERQQMTLAAATDALTASMAEHAVLELGQSVLDIGCGTGQPACWLGQQYAVSVTGISPSRVCVERANQRASRCAVSPQPEFVIGDGMALCFPDQSFDRVWVMESSHLVPDKPKLIAEATRVLCSAGRLVLCDIVLGHKLSLQEVIQYRDEFLLLKDVFGRAIMEPLDFYCQQLQDRGMKVVQRIDISAKVYPTFAHWRENAWRNRDAVIADIGEQGWQQFVDACDVLEKMWQKDLLGYGLIAAQKPAA